MAEFTIEKNVPLPNARASSGKYPFGDMKKGESFLRACPIEDQDKVVASLANAASTYRKNVATVSGASGAGGDVSVKFTVRKVEGGVRCWRVA